MFYSSFPTIDLHGYDRDYARIKTEEFINDNYKLHKRDIVIVHGKGLGILKKEVNKLLSNNKKVESYKVDLMNTGCTIVRLSKNI